MRLTRLEYYLTIAETVATRSTCPKAKVGAVLVNTENHHIVSMGYNGSAKQAPHCIDIGCLEVDLHTGHGQKSCIRTIHAELNAILHLEKSYENLTLYVTHQPCFQCFKALVAANVTKIYYIFDYKDEIRDLLHKEIPWITMCKVL